MEKENEGSLEMMNLEEEIKLAERLYKEAIKNVKPRKPKEHIIFIRNIPFIVSEDTYAKYFQVQVEWLNPKLIEKALKDTLHISTCKRRRPRMYV